MYLTPSPTQIKAYAEKTTSERSILGDGRAAQQYAYLPLAP